MGFVRAVWKNISPPSCNRAFAATTSLPAILSVQAGGLAAQSLDVLFQVRLGPLRLHAPVSQRDYAISRQTV